MPAHQPPATTHPTARLLGTSPAMATLRTQIQQLARFDTPGNPAVPTLLLQGETGTGKSVIARVVHDSGPRAARTFVAVNCATLPETMLEAELFGFEAGAFTDAKRAKPGLFETAASGTLFLDEIDAVPLALQGKLLTALESKRVRRLGAVTDRGVDVKLIAATNAALGQAMATGRLRADLYHRLAVVVLTLPPLRERGDDVLELAQAHLARLAQTHGLTPKRLQTDAVQWLRAYAWPGNVRELEHLLERVVLLQEESEVTAATLTHWCQVLPEAARTPEPSVPEAVGTPQDDEPLLVLPPEAQQLQEALLRTGGNVAQAARLLGLSRDQFRLRMRRHGVTRPRLTPLAPSPLASSDTTLAGQNGPSMSPPEESIAPRELPPSPPPIALPLATSSAPQTSLRGVPSEQGAERRQLTVLFCDLVDATTLAGSLDPEDWQEVMHLYHTTCTDVVARFAGHVAQYLGDGVLVYFGYPQAHEDDAQRAVHAGLALLEGVVACNQHLERTFGVRLAGRVGIHTGLVVIGEMGGDPLHGRLASGVTPNIAYKIQAFAPPGSVVMSAVTSHLVQGYFVCQSLGAQPLAGVAEPLPLYHVLRPSAARGRLEAAAALGFTPLVGRAEELALLHARWAQVQQGMGQVVVLSGDAGLGKSRLLRALVEHLAETPMTYLKCQCSPYHQHTALYPLVDLVQRLLRYDSPVSSEALLARVEDLLQAQGLHTPEHVTLLASLLTVALSSMPEPSSQLSPLQQRQRTLELLLALLLTMARAQPVLFVIEDVHWIDPSTLEWLGLLMDQGPTTRILTLLICRPTFQVPWGGRDHVTPLTLNPLPASQAAHMVRTMVGAHSLPAALLEQIVAHTDGVPLFVEEVTKFVLASRQLHGPAEDPLSDAPVALTIPTTLHDSLMARLDQMGAAKGTAQLAATIGREWSFALLRAVATTEENTLRQDLRRLVDAELLYQRGVGDQATYVFRHALIQEAAARSLLRRTRQHYHHWIAQALETQFADVATGQPELVAHHYTKAGLLAQALPYWQRAGQRAVERSAHAEAIAHLSRGLAWLATLPETPERAQQELSLYLILGPALMATKGWASAEVEHAYTTALARCQQLGDTPQRLHILMGFAFVHVVRANLAQTQILGEQLLTLAQRHQDPVGLVGAALHLGGAAFGRGEFVQARRYFDQPHSDYNTRHHPAPIVLGGADAGVFCLAWGSHALWLLGYAEQACTQSTATQSRAQELAHPLSQAIALAYAAMLQQFLRNETTVLTLAEAAKTLCMDHGFRYYLAWSTILQGWGLLRQGHGEAGMTQMRQGMDALQATGARRSWAYYGALMAEAYGRSGEPEEGLRLLGEAFAHVQHTGECWWEAELYRLKGALLQRTQSPHPTGETPEAFFRQALAVARRQQAKGLELRAAISLSRLWQQQGKHTEARELLAPLYGWFSEGLDTVDLQEAQALLEVLNR